MRKLKLDVDALQVQTFQADDDAGSYGTVQAHDSWETTGGPLICQADCGDGGSGYDTCRVC
ncbi:hypothetical protein [Longimicrobium sp.]|jgi:hypothetical protein|uniref:hypothetical protein n=1 Tax=Longimicrobium sp. TaxID=2029185 RepID=UPI002ED90740